jgi:hypothetical protein
MCNNYSTKYWITENIKDCGNLINDEKLKEKYNDDNIFKLSNEYSNTRNQNFDKSNRINKNNKYTNKQQSHRYENKNYRNVNSKETNKYINVSRNNNFNNYKEKMHGLSKDSSISEYDRRIKMLDSYSKSNLNNNTRTG